MEEPMTASYPSPAHIDPEDDLEDPSNNFNWGSYYELSDFDDGFDFFEYEPGRTAPRHFEPLAPRLKDVNPQLSSTLYNGRMAPEIRTQILEYVLTENDSKEYSHNNHYSRPNYRSHKGILTNLLLTCRRIYLEAHHLLLINKEHIFWHYREPDNVGYEDEEYYFRRFRPDQLALVRKVHLFTQQFWLEQSLQRVCKLEVMQGIEKMTITLRRGDWWHWEHSAELGINPQRGSADVKIMEADWRAEELGIVIPWAENAWGCVFKHIAALKELEMEFETSVYEEAELLRIVEHARTWRFPMSDDPNSGVKRVLSAEGRSIRKSTWRGPMCVWSQNCPECEHNGTYINFPEAVAGHKPLPEGWACEVCKERKSLMDVKLGPTLVVFSLRWKIAPADMRPNLC